jgi:hypothetical protein
MAGVTLKNLEVDKTTWVSFSLKYIFFKEERRERGFNWCGEH